jgi:hypothetical protein
MFCDGCGSELHAQSNFCNRCGKPITGPTPAGKPARRNLSEHIRLLGILWPALSALDGMQAVALYFVANIIFNPNTHPERPAFLHPMLSFLALLLVIKAFAGFAAGWGLLQREPWARSIAVVLGFISLFFNVPFGTALGIYTLWVLLPSGAEQAYQEEVQTAGQRRVTSP